MWVCAHEWVQVPKEARDWSLTWVLGTEVGSFGRAPSTLKPLNHPSSSSPFLLNARVC